MLSCGGVRYLVCVVEPLHDVVAYFDPSGRPLEFWAPPFPFSLSASSRAARPRERDAAEQLRLACDHLASAVSTTLRTNQPCRSRIELIPTLLEEGEVRGFFLQKSLLLLHCTTEYHGV